MNYPSLFNELLPQYEPKPINTPYIEYEDSIRYKITAYIITKIKFQPENCGLSACYDYFLENFNILINDPQEYTQIEFASIFRMGIYLEFIQKQDETSEPIIYPTLPSSLFQ